MIRIEISKEVWNEIAKHGKFGESEDDVLRRILKIPPLQHPEPQGVRAALSARTSARSGSSSVGRRVATTRMSSYVQNGTLVVEFVGGPRKSFSLPSRDDKAALRRRRDEAVEFARASGASYGQEMAVKKALTEAGYHLVK